jgi:hypothetical protein
MRDAFAQHRNPERIFTYEVLEYLHSLDHRTWHEWNKGQPMNAHALSGLLRKHFNIYSRGQRRDKQRRRGYHQSDFTEAWERYLPAQGEGMAEETRPQESVVSEGGFRSPDHPIYRSPDLFHPAFRPIKSHLVTMSQFKARWAKRWTKGRSVLRQLAGKAIGLFVATRT